MAEVEMETEVPLAFTEAALAKVAELLAEDGNPALKLRIYVTGGGCSGLQYGFAFDEKIADDDFHIRKNGVSMLIDATSLQYLAGAEIGYSDDLDGSRFVIKNPNASTTCGCGSSFTV